MAYEALRGYPPKIMPNHPVFGHVRRASILHLTRVEHVKERASNPKTTRVDWHGGWAMDLWRDARRFFVRRASNTLADRGIQVYRPGDADSQSGKALSLLRPPCTGSRFPLAPNGRIWYSSFETAVCMVGRGVMFGARRPAEPCAPLFVSVCLYAVAALKPYHAYDILITPTFSSGWR